jgi:(p)ppGpp synthase/HD superfamily hydrolase
MRSVGEDPSGPMLGPAFDEAVAYAIEIHRRQVRKATDIPYVTHLFAVCSHVLEDGGTEAEAIAALLHDAVEDQGGQRQLAEIDRRFGADVARLVEALSDAVPASGEDKPPWRERKEAYLVRLADEPPDVLRISLADKLHNARSIEADWEQIGDAVFDRFNAHKTDQAWYFGELLGIFEAGLPRSRNLPAFRSVVARLFSG